MKNSLPLISIYIVSKNYGKYVSKAIKSILKQTYKNWELYLINDNSSDDTIKIFKKYKSKNKKIIKVLNFKRNTGLQKISNNILKICNGKYILRLDADDWMNENALSIMIFKMLSVKNCKVVYSGYFYVDENNTVLGFENNLVSINNKNNFPPHGACMLINTRSLKEVGGYNIKTKAQDGWDIWFKLKRRVKFSSIDLPLFYYRKHGSSLSDNHKKIISARSKIIRAQRNKRSSDYNPKILAIIPIKKDFKGKKNVPFIEYKNQNLIDHAFDSIRNSKLINNIMVSSTSTDVLSYCKKKKIKGKNFFINKRTKKLNASINKFEDILIDSSNRFKINKKFYPDIVVFINLHIIRKDFTHIDDSIELLISNQKDSVFSVIKENNPIFKVSKAKLKPLNKGRFDRLDFNNETLFKFDNSIIVAWDSVLREKKIFNGDIGFIETDPSNFIKPIK